MRILASCRRSVLFLSMAMAITFWGAWLVAPGVQAGATDPNHRFESLRVDTPGVAVLLELPGTSRALAFHRDGRVSTVIGANLVEEGIGTIPAETSCPEHGVLAATWDPAAIGSIAFVSYTAARNTALAVGRLDVTTGAFQEVYSYPAAVPCTNVGGGIAFGADGTIYLGVGDLGTPAQAGAAGARAGKILRMTRAGGPPSAPDAPNPLVPSSLTYAFGVRNPVAIAADPAGTDLWFVDQGPGDEDELNLVAPLANYGWGPTQQMGALGIGGLEDPYFTWGPGVAVSTLQVDRSGSLNAAFLGSLLAASAGSGEISSIQPDRTNRLLSRRTLLFQPDATGPQAFVGLRILPDGDLYVVDDAGGISRLLPLGGVPREPSAIDSIVPLIATKLTSGEIEIAFERVPGAAESGLHVGNVLTLSTVGYTHDDQAATYTPVNDAGDAWTRVLALPDTIGGPGASAYFLASARRNCLESGLGQGSFGSRPQSPSPCTVDVLGGGTHDITNVEVTVVATAVDRLNLPRDLAFHPDVAGELWVINTADNSAIILHDTGQPTQWSTRHSGAGGEHFYSHPAALAFGPGTQFLATIQEEDDYTQGPPPGGTPADFMGPTLWISDSNQFEAGHASHYDMLHNSPNGVGIAWESGNAYWVYDGYHRSLTRYDFVQDHGPGGADHSDAIVTRFVDGQLGYAPEIGSHVQHDPVTGLVYAADTANSRIVVLDPTTGFDGGAIAPNYDGCSQRAVTGATLTTLVDGALVGLVAPSGLELHDGMIFVSDNATSRIFAFDMAGGVVDYLDTGFTPGTLMGMSFDPVDGSLCIVDTRLNRVLRIRPR